MKKLRTCYDDVLKVASKTSGTITIKLIFDKRGRIATMQYASDPIKNKGLRSCIAKVLNETAFPAPATAEKVVVTLVISFMQ